MPAPAPSPPPAPLAEARNAPRLIAGAGAALVLAATWAVVSGIRWGTWRERARTEEARLDKTHELLADADFRGQLAAAVKTLNEDAVPFRTKLKGLSDKRMITLDGPPNETVVGIPSRGEKEVIASFGFKDVSLERFLDYACAVELGIPGALVTDVTLKPIKDAGNRWEVQLKVSKRIKNAP